jgi:hypothetical protein
MSELPASSLHELWMDAHYQIVEQRDYVGLRLTLYDLSTPMAGDRSWHKARAGR